MECKNAECRVQSVGENSKVHRRHRSGPLEAWEEVTQRAAKVQDDR